LAELSLSALPHPRDANARVVDANDVSSFLSLSTPSAPEFGVEMEGRGDAQVGTHHHLGDQRDGPLLCHIRSHIWGPVIFPLAVSLSTPSVNSGRVRCEAERVGSGWSTSRVHCTRISRFCATFSRLAPHPSFYSNLLRDSIIISLLFSNNLTKNDIGAYTYEARGPVTTAHVEGSL
jgi:hypothetical protein